MRTLWITLLSLLVLATACASTATTSSSRPTTDLVDADGERFVSAPVAPTGDLSAETRAVLDAAFADLGQGVDRDAALAIGQTGDARVAWLLTDLMRFSPSGPGTGLIEAFDELTGLFVNETFPWKTATNALIAWDIPAPPDYVKWKRIPFELQEPKWGPFFDDADANIDWRIYSWGGVLIDDRPRAETDGDCFRCIPALNDPATTDAAGGSWWPDDRIVFGIVVGDDTIAIPKNIAEVHEMFNLNLGGRRLAIPYCTLCGSAQAFVTDNVIGQEGELLPTLELRTSGLLARSNKVMFDLDTFSVFDTFTGQALSGPLQDEAVQLEQLTVVTTRWGDWKAAHPATRIVAEDGGIGRSYAADPLRGRDDAGPIFPVGQVDPRLAVQDSVVGVTTAAGTPLAFPTDAARAALTAGQPVELEGVTLRADGGGFRAELTDGTPIAAHESFWFAWSQFHPDTELWAG